MCQLIGEVAVRSLGIPLPGALIGLMLLTVGLIVLGKVPQALAQVSGGLLRNMMLLLAPAVVGLIDNFARVREEWLPFLAACVVGGVSAYGGSGTVFGMVVGATLIGVINLGMNLMGVDADWQKIVKGGVLLGAVVFDILAAKKNATK